MSLGLGNMEIRNALWYKMVQKKKQKTKQKTKQKKNNEYENFVI